MRMVTKLVLRVALLAIVIGGLSVTLTAMPGERPAAGAFRWVQSLSQTERGFYLRDSVLRSLPSEYRTALLDSIPRGQARVAFWEAAFTAYRDSRELSPKQMATLNLAIQQTATTLDGSLQSKESLRSLIASLGEAFGQAGMKELLYKSNASVGSNQLPIAERLAYDWRHFRVKIASRLGGTASEDPNCNCVTWEDCGTGWKCSSNPSCNAVAGCGSTCVDYCVPDGQPRD